MIKTNKYVIDKNKEDLKDISQQSGEISALGAKEVAKSVTKGVMEEVQPDNNLADKNEKQIFCKLFLAPNLKKLSTVFLNIVAFLEY